MVDTPEAKKQALFWEDAGVKKVNRWDAVAVRLDDGGEWRSLPGAIGVGGCRHLQS